MGLRALSWRALVAGVGLGRSHCRSGTPRPLCMFRSILRSSSPCSDGSSGRELPPGLDSPPPAACGNSTLVKSCWWAQVPRCAPSSVMIFHEGTAAAGASPFMRSLSVMVLMSVLSSSVVATMAVSFVRSYMVPVPCWVWWIWFHISLHSSARRTWHWHGCWAGFPQPPQVVALRQCSTLCWDSAAAVLNSLLHLQRSLSPSPSFRVHSFRWSANAPGTTGELHAVHAAA